MQTISDLTITSSNPDIFIGTCSDVRYGDNAIAHDCLSSIFTGNSVSAILVTYFLPKGTLTLRCWHMATITLYAIMPQIIFVILDFSDFVATSMIRLAIPSFDIIPLDRVCSTPSILSTVSLSEATSDLSDAMLNDKAFTSSTSTLLL